MTLLAQAVLDKSRHLLRDDLHAIELCLAQVPDADLWWRPSEASNSIGHLLQHLNGSLTEWIIGGVDRRPYVRDRAQEFITGAQPRTGADLYRALEATVEDVTGVIGRLDETSLLARRQVRQLDVSVLEALLHSVHHFGEHTGQIIMITKIRTGTDLGLMSLRTIVPSAP